VTATSSTSDRGDPATSTAQTVAEFLHTFLSGDIENARSLVTDDFTFRAPLIEAVAGKETFFAGATEKSTLIRSFRILRQWEDADDVSTVYELDIVTPGGEARMMLHEWHTVRDGKLASTSMVFDTAARAAGLIHDALMSHDHT
jgi:ketosteroid isomerase-like protein